MTTFTNNNDANAMNPITEDDIANYLANTPTSSNAMPSCWRRFSSPARTATAP